MINLFRKGGGLEGKDGGLVGHSYFSMSNADSSLKRIKDTVESMLQDLEGGNALLFQSKIPRIATEATASLAVSEKSWVNIMEDMKVDCPNNLSISQKREDKETVIEEKCRPVEENGEMEEGKTEDNAIYTSSMSNQAVENHQPLSKTRIDNYISPINHSIISEKVIPPIEMNCEMETEVYTNDNNDNNDNHDNNNNNDNNDKEIPTTPAIQIQKDEQTFMRMEVNEEKNCSEEDCEKNEEKAEQQYLQPNLPSPQTGLKRILDELDHAILESSKVSTSSSKSNHSLSPSHDSRPASTVHPISKSALAELAITHLVFTYIANHGCAVGLLYSSNNFKNRILFVYSLPM